MLELGGRPSGPLQLEPNWTTVTDDGVLYWLDHRGKPDVECSLGEAYRWARHWGLEQNRFEEELACWQKFRSAQQKVHQESLSKIFERLKMPMKDNKQVSAMLTKLTDWQDFQSYQREKVDRVKQWQEACRQKLEEFMEDEKIAVTKDSKEGVRSKLKMWLSALQKRQHRLEEVEEELKSAMQQCSEILSEMESSIVGTTVLSELEKAIELQARMEHDTLQDLGGRHVQPIQHSIQFEKQDLLHRLEFERSTVEEEVREWKKFLEWRTKETEFNSGIAKGRYKEESSWNLSLWQDLVAYRSIELNKAKSWEKCWCRYVEWDEQKINGKLVRELVDILQEDARLGRRYVKLAQDNLEISRAKLEWSQQQVVEIQEALTAVPQKASALSQSPPRDLGFRSWCKRPILADHGIVMNSPDAVLRPVHSGRIAKTNDPKTSLRSKQKPVSTMSKPKESLSIRPNRKRDNTSPVDHANQGTKTSAETAGKTIAVTPSYGNAAPCRRSERLVQQKKKKNPPPSRTAIYTDSQRPSRIAKNKKPKAKARKVQSKSHRS